MQKIKIILYSLIFFQFFLIKCLLEFFASYRIYHQHVLAFARAYITFISFIFTTLKCVSPVAQSVERQATERNSPSAVSSIPGRSTFFFFFFHLFSNIFKKYLKKYFNVVCLNQCLDNVQTYVVFYVVCCVFGTSSLRNANIEQIFYIRR